MPIKSIKRGEDIPSNQVGIATNPRAENSLSELSFEGHPRQLNSNIYTNKLNDPSAGQLVYKPFPVEPFTSLRSDFEYSTQEDVSQFTDVRVKGDFMFIGAPFRNTGSASSYNSPTKDAVGLVYIYKLDGTHWASIPSPAPGERSKFAFGFSLDYDPSVGKIYVGALDYNQTTGGLLYIYDWDGSRKLTTSDWGTPTIVQASDRLANQKDYFGTIVRAINGKVVVSAARGGPNSYGKVYVYDSNGSNEVAITPSDSYYSGTTNVKFGCSIDVDGNPTDGYKIAIGSWGWEDGGNSYRKGAAFVYNLDGTGEVMILPERGRTTRRCFDYGNSVAIDVSAGKIFITCPDSTDTEYSWNTTDIGTLAICNLDGTGQINIDPVFDATPNPKPWSSWPSSAKFAWKIGLNRNTQRIFAYQSNLGPSGRLASVQIMDYDGSDLVVQRLWDGPADTYPDPNGDPYPFGKLANETAKFDQAAVQNNSPTFDDNPVEYMFETELSESSFGVHANRRWCVTDSGSLIVVGTATVYHPMYTQTYGKLNQNNFGTGYVIKGLDS